MAGKSDYYENQVLDLLFGNKQIGTSWPGTAATAGVAGTHYFALFTVSPNEAGTGGTEVTGGSYARKAVTNNTTNWNAASSGSKTNAAAIDFVAATANWGTIVSFGIYDASTGGNLLFFGNLTTPRTVNTGDIPRFAAGAFVINED